MCVRNRNLNKHAIKTNDIKMTLRSAFATLLVSTIFFTSIGACLGFSLAKLTPGYYRMVFKGGGEPDFDPVGVGIGLGLTQGFVGGVVVGLILVALLGKRETQILPISCTPNTEPVPTERRSNTKRVLLITGSLFTMALCLFIAGLIGILIGEKSAYHRQFLEEEKAISPILKGDPAYVRVAMYEDIGVTLIGEVATQKDLDHMKSKLTTAIGESRTKDAMSGIYVRR
jgi:hypothetical protein